MTQMENNSLHFHTHTCTNDESALHIKSVIVPQFGDHKFSGASW